MHGMKYAPSGQQGSKRCVQRLNATPPTRSRNRRNGGRRQASTLELVILRNERTARIVSRPSENRSHVCSASDHEGGYRPQFVLQLHVCTHSEARQPWSRAHLAGLRCWTQAVLSLKTHLVCRYVCCAFRLKRRGTNAVALRVARGSAWLSTVAILPVERSGTVPSLLFHARGCFG